MLNIVPNPDERGLLVGTTGCGKTTLAKYLLACCGREYRVVHDSKDRIYWPHYERHTKLATLRDSRYPRLIYAPDHFELDDWETIEDFFRWCFMRQHTTLYVDEVFAVTKRNTIPHYYKAALARGRQLGVQVISGTQRPKDIPLVILSESENKYLFMLQLSDDRQRMAEMTGISKEEQTTLRKHEFFYAKIGGIRTKRLTLDFAAPIPS